MRCNEWNKAHELRPDKQTNEGFARAALRRLGGSAALPTAIDVVLGGSLESSMCSGTNACGDDDRLL